MIFLKILNQKANQLKRLKLLKHQIANIGDIVEDESSITCYVSQRLLEKNAKPAFYELFIRGMNTANNSKKELINYYGLDKPVHYVFDGIRFYCSPIKIRSYLCKITFKNCKFEHSPITILQADKIVFENNQYRDILGNLKNESFLRTTPNTVINELTFRNEKFENLYKHGKEQNDFGMDVCAKKVDILESKMITDSNNGPIFIKAKRIEIVRSLLESPEIYFDTDFVDATKSQLKAEKGLIVGNSTNTCDIEINTDDVFSPYVVFNGVEWVNYESGNRTFYHDDPIKLKSARKELVQVFNNIKEKYTTITEDNQKILELQRKFQ